MLDAFRCGLTDIEKNEVWETTYMNIMGAFVFVLFILFVTGKKTAVPDLTKWGLPGICLNLWALCKVTWYSPGSMNPALAVGCSIFQYWQWEGENKDLMLFYMPWYMIGSAVGGILAGLFYILILEPQFPDQEEEETLGKGGSNSINHDDQ